jgi:hypothetical protein
MFGIENPGHSEDHIGGLAVVLSADPKVIPVEPGRLMIQGEPYVIAREYTQVIEDLEAAFRVEKADAYSSFSHPKGMHFFIYGMNSAYKVDRVLDSMFSPVAKKTE